MSDKYQICHAPIMPGETIRISGASRIIGPVTAVEQVRGEDGATYELVFTVERTDHDSLPCPTCEAGPKDCRC